ncbi:MAG: low molecular weight protein-tyrosine-phosphatase [Planctomycetota bacterium]
MPDPDRHDATRLCFVCLGNICRSPLAEGIFIHLATQRGVIDRFRIDSCGTGDWHIGERPDPRALAVATKNGVELPSRGRQIDASLDSSHDLLLAMDRSNRDNIIRAGVPEDRIRMMLSFHPDLADDAEVPDPYFGGDEGFDDVFEMLTRACEGLLTHYGD